MIHKSKVAYIEMCYHYGFTAAFAERVRSANVALEKNSCWNEPLHHNDKNTNNKRDSR